MPEENQIVCEYCKYSVFRDKKFVLGLCDLKFTWLSIKRRVIRLGDSCEYAVRLEVERVYENNKKDIRKK